MSALDDLKDRIDAAIYSNEDQLITGDGLQTVLDDMVDTMGVSVSQNTLTIGGEDKGDLAGQNVENSGWLWIVIDKNSRVLLGIKKDGSFVWFAGIPEHLKEYIATAVSTATDGKVDKVEGKGLIDTDFAEGIKYVNNDEYLELKEDAVGRFLNGIRVDGTHVLIAPFEFGSFTIETTANNEWLEIELDSVGHFLYGRKKDGSLYLAGLDDAVNKIIDKRENLYDKILVANQTELLKDWIPFYKGTPGGADVFSTNDYYDRCNLLFFTDSHIDEESSSEQSSYQNLCDTIDFINSCPVKLDAVLQGGDNITPFDRVSHDYAYAWAKRYYDVLKQSQTPVVCIRGNHDNNDWNNFPSEVITIEDYNNLWVDFAEHRYGIVRDSNAKSIKVVDGVAQETAAKSIYHYFDIPKHKIRVIAVDVEDIDRVTTNNDGWCKFYGTTMNYVAQEQMNWIANTALKNLEEGWGVIFVMHQSIWLYPSFHDPNNPQHSLVWYASRGDGVHTIEPGVEWGIPKLFRIAHAFNTQGSYSDSYQYEGQQYDNYYDLDINVDYSEYASMTNKPHVICWLMGHEHQDFNVKIGIDGSDNIVVDEENGINFIWTAQAAAWMGASDARLVKIPGTPTQNCFDMINIDTVHRKIRTFRYGAGKNCYGVGGDRFLNDGISY